MRSKIKAVEFVKVTATFYDGEGKVVASDWAYTEEDEIPPGGTGVFEMIMIYEDLVPEVDHLSIIVDAQPK